MAAKAPRWIKRDRGHMAEEMVDAMFKFEGGEMSPADAGALFRQMIHSAEPPPALTE